MPAKFEVYQDARGEFRFRLKAGNGEIVATGEGYKTRGPRSPERHRHPFRSDPSRVGE